MTLEEAIQVNEVTERDEEIQFWTASREAIKLGIEALKLYKRYKDTGSIGPAFMLPGETKE